MSDAVSRWQPSNAASFLLPPGTHDHKYSRGVLGLRTGSVTYPGAAVLGAEAAWRTGVGLVQFVPQIDANAPKFGLPTPAAAVLAARPETVISRADRKLTAWLIGSGTDPAERSPAETAELLAVLAGSRPVVADAGALELCVRTRLSASPKAPLALTPHAGEFAAVWRALGRPQPADNSEAAAALALALSCTVVLKGPVTLIAAPDGTLLRVGPATPWLATAGTGDVLAGILGALAARHAADITLTGRRFAELAATAALLHDAAARSAAGTSSQGRPITALDVAEHLPAAIDFITS
ncbi:ADP/ATP-dependent (S)-NAD(P)H-hydrate dehydratase [Leucobacter sp. CX328]|uniref:ADP-dependent NAD(P)H-hydrate dehydratase n=1 Tax=unclassified Leucobacter TaxID=2621730 RepID=UPI00334288FA